MAIDFTEAVSATKYFDHANKTFHFVSEAADKERKRQKRETFKGLHAHVNVYPVKKLAFFFFFIPLWMQERMLAADNEHLQSQIKFSIQQEWHVIHVFFNAF